MFDNMEQQEGWGYLMAKLFQLPRSEKFRQMVEARRRLIDRKMQAQLRRQLQEASRMKRMSRSLKGPTSQSMNGSKIVLQPSGASPTANRQGNENAAKEAHEKKLEKKLQ